MELVCVHLGSWAGLPWAVDRLAQNSFWNETFDPVIAPRWKSGAKYNRKPVPSEKRRNAVLRFDTLQGALRPILTSV